VSVWKGRIDPRSVWRIWSPFRVDQECRSHTLHDSAGPKVRIVYPFIRNKINRESVCDLLRDQDRGILESVTKGTFYDRESQEATP
jgi:hypothetical protein